MMSEPAISSSKPTADPEVPAPDAWSTRQRILVILAHPDDPEFFCGATLAKWAATGHEIIYWLITCGDKGTSNRSISSDQLCEIRYKEQNAAAAVIGATRVNFLGYPDGYLVPDLKLRREITRIIRLERPDILVTCDPTNLYAGGSRLNHPDHRAAGQVVLDAVFPAARDHLYFPELLQQENLEPHVVREVWVSLAPEPEIKLDVTAFWETKIRALQEHKSQIGDPDKLAERMRARLAPGNTPEAPRYEEGFRRLVLA